MQNDTAFLMKIRFLAKIFFLPKPSLTHG